MRSVTSHWQASFFLDSSFFSTNIYSPLDYVYNAVTNLNGHHHDAAVTAPHHTNTKNRDSRQDALRVPGTVYDNA